MFRLPGYDKATAEERAAAIARTLALREAELSDSDRWADPAMHYAAWAGRGAVLARYIRPGERVFEFGAGVRSARTLLPDSCAYVASDLTPHGPDTVIYDLNAAPLARLEGFDVALLSGVLEYVHSLPQVAGFFASCFSVVVCSYAPAGDRSPATLERRRYAGWFSNLSAEEFACLFRDAGYHETIREAWEGQALFRFERRASVGMRP